VALRRMNWRLVDLDILIPAEEGYARREHESLAQTGLRL
jgi:hypothetical protein